MREIVSLQVGQGGNQMGAAFWEALCAEHHISPETGDYTGESDLDLEHIEVYFREGAHKGRYVPRVTMVDLEPSSLDAIRGGRMGHIFSPDDFVGGQYGASNNWAKGYYTEGSERLDEVLDVVRKQAEGCERLQGFQMCHTLGGGTGSGLGSLLLCKLREEYPDRMILTFSVLPSKKVSNTVVEPYNATLAMTELIDSANETVLLDNEALFNICVKTLGTPSPTHSDLNSLVSIVMSGMTSSMRYPGLLNADLRKLAVNLVPFPRLHFFLVGAAPLRKYGTEPYVTESTAQLMRQAFHKDNIMCDVDLHCKYLTASVILRGDFSTYEVEYEMLNLKRDPSFVDWIPNSIMSAICSVPPAGLKRSAVSISNTTGIKKPLVRISKQFNQMFNSRAYVHWYTQEGLEEFELAEAGKHLDDLIAEYDQYSYSSFKYDSSSEEPDAEVDGGAVGETEA